MTPLVLLAASAEAAPMIFHLCDLRATPPSPYVGTPACECARRGELFWYGPVVKATDPYGIDGSCFEITERADDAAPLPDPSHDTILDALLAKAKDLAYAAADVFVHDDVGTPHDQLMSGEMGTEEDGGPPPILIPFPGGFDVRDGSTQSLLAHLQVGAAPVVEAHLVESPGGAFDDLLLVLGDGGVWIAPGPLVGGSYTPPM